jgi:hypothetical protein
MPDDTTAPDPRPASMRRRVDFDTGPESTAPVTADEQRALFDELDKTYKAASAALAADDMQTWAEHAGRGAEIHEELARRNGWRDGGHDAH